MKIGFFLDNHHIPQADFRNPEKGSPGVGASEYTQIAVPYFLKKYFPEKVEVIILAPFIEKMPSHIKAITAVSIEMAAQLAKKENVDYFVFRARQKDNKEIIDFIDSIALPSIGVGQLTPFPEAIRQIRNSKYFKSLVCVGREQYDLLIDTHIRKKLAYIDNGVHVESCWIGAKEKTDPRLVVFMGALVPVKGFHKLAKAWPKVLNVFPDAKLSVIGSIKVYGDKLSVGPLGIASEEYERNYIIPHLCDDRGLLHPSITFHGQMEQDKFSIIRKAAVGVVNPTGQSETCCVSAIEMSACKIPVVTGAYFALLDTVLHERTGLLGRSTDALAKNICMCLADPDFAKTLGEEGYKRALNQYDFSEVARKWIELFHALDRGQIPKAYGKIKNIQYHLKWLRILNCLPQTTIGTIIPWLSILELESLVHGKIKRIKSLLKSIILTQGNLNDYS